MAGRTELSLRSGGRTERLVTASAALAAIAAGVAAGLGVPQSDKWAVLCVVIAVAAVGYALGMLMRRVEAGPDGLRYRTVLRWHRLEWEEILRFEDLRVQPADSRSRGTHLRVSAKLHGDALVWLPLPYAGEADTRTFEAQLAELRALHRRYAHRTPAPQDS
ncbi:PH domain-containing protein [Streptomyces sp. NPDC056160]|uniref:PH domain-containing protein n=1 Tax=Streptomyces sp. NPDC056160 TaxID=3345731 RepID=UPI0035DFC562